MRKRSFRCFRHLMAGGALLVLGCTDVSDGGELELSASVTAGVGPVELTSANDLDDWFTKVSERVPGFAGAYLDDNGDFVIALTDPLQADHARAVTAQAKTDLGLTQDAKIVLADFGFAYLASQRERAWQVGTDMGLIWFDIAEARNRVVLGIRSEDDRQRVEQALDRVGVAKASRIVTVVGPIRNDVQTILQTLSSKRGGLRIEPDPGGFCTLGFNARHAGTTVFATASHCSATFAGLDDLQPWGQAQRGNTFIGTESEDPARSWYSGCPVFPWPVCRRSDVMLGEYELSGSDTAIVGLSARVEVQGTFTINPTDKDYEIHSGLSTAWNTMDVWMTGQANGRQNGKINGTCVTFYDDSLSTYFTCLYSADYDTKKGDSGAPVLYEHPNGDIRLVGLHKGRGNDTLALISPWGNIQIEFSMAATAVNYQGPPPPPPDPPTWVNIDALSPDEVQPNDFCTWFGSAGGGDPPYTFKWYKGPTLVQTDVGTNTELSMDTGTADFILKLVALNGGGSVQTTLSVDVTSSADPCFA